MCTQTSFSFYSLFNTTEICVFEYFFDILMVYMREVYRTLYNPAEARDIFYSRFIRCTTLLSGTQFTPKHSYAKEHLDRKQTTFLGIILE